LLCGYCPFAGDTDCETLNLVKEGILEFPSPEWDSISDEAMDFIRQLLDRNPKTRPTAAQAMKHPWIAKVVVKPGLPPPRPFVSPKTSSPSSEGDDRPTSLLSELRMNSTRASAFQKYLVASKVKKALARASVDLTPKEAALLGEVFQRVDEDRDGCITTSDLEGALKADTFSSVVRRNLKQMRTHLLRNPSVTFDIRPYMPFVKQRARSDLTKGRKL
jgi:serine/threonine protein kinase